MDDGTRSRNWMSGSATAADHRPEPRRLLAPLLTVALALATPLALPIPVAVVLVLAALAWLGSRIQEAGGDHRVTGESLRAGSAGAPHSRDRPAYSGEWV
ncbi:hypothetical protein C8K36_10199 [Rhodococcus sp. OK519]|uniref:hypothetical protein n=1 Tax=Rhodococcus sp. OK519 TaxID=2135729 RepID=UPI000D3A3C7D|nr:hypothetical protein C8K36_10199 [Rhodococcus sp. OK519]